jgi:hypothetical protein
MIGEFVVVRTYSAGVHMGTLRECHGTAVVLTDARRLHRWRGANTLNEVSQNGVAEGSRISEPVPEILLTQAIEVIPCSPHAKQILCESVWPR